MGGVFLGGGAMTMTVCVCVSKCSDPQCGTPWKGCACVCVLTIASYWEALCLEYEQHVFMCKNLRVLYIGTSL